MLFGWGDGGGGPTPRMIETIARAHDLQGLPRTAIRTSDEFFERLEAEDADLPTIVGELYFEYHRGAYTTQARTKRANRRAEQLLHDVEFLAAATHRLKAVPYPAAEIEGLWQRLCLNAFHDILPGSSIGLVYEDAERDYDWILSEGERLREAALDALGYGEGSSPVNTLTGNRREIAEAPGGELVWVECPSYGAGRIGTPPDRVTVADDGDRIVLENDILRAILGREGELRSLVEKETGREALAEAGNRLELYDDRPTAFDAWDIDPFHLETGVTCEPADSVALTWDGPLRAEVVFDRKIGVASSARQTIRLDAGGCRLEFHTEIEWHEEHRLLKVAFPTAVRAESATYEMQFGVAERPTHYSTSHDLARYEVPGHRFADLSEYGFGVALLSSSTYGWSTYGGTMRMSLLRAPTSPDPGADRGRQSISYAVMPHAGGWQEAGVVAEAHRFNAPVVWAPGHLDPVSFVAIDDPNLVLDTVKRAEDSDALVLRLYEAHGASGIARVRLGFPFEDARFCNLLEDDLGAARVAAGAIEVPYRPFEIVSLKVS